MNLAVVILAAGSSSRMGRPKLLLPWNGTTVLGHLIEQWRGLCPAQLAVVTNPGHQTLHDELNRVGIGQSQIIFNSAPERGMFSSVQCAARWNGWVPNLTHWAITLGDQPLVRSDTLNRLLGFITANQGDVHQPSRNGRGRHPVVLSRNLFVRLQSSCAEDLKQFLVTSGTTMHRYEIDDPGLDLDLDEPGDYDRALALLKAQRAGRENETPIAKAH